MGDAYLNCIRCHLEVRFIVRICYKVSMTVGQCYVVAGLLHFEMLRGEIAIHAKSAHIFQLVGVVLVRCRQVDARLWTSGTECGEGTFGDRYVRTVCKAVQSQVLQIPPLP